MKKQPFDLNQRISFVLGIGIFIAFIILAGFGFLTQVKDAESIASYFDKWGKLFAVSCAFIGLSVFAILNGLDRVEKRFAEIKEELQEEKEKSASEEADSGL